MDTASVIPRILKSKLIYFIHTQESGLTGKSSDSFWRHAPAMHSRLEKAAVASATHTVVFNPDYARQLQAEDAGRVHFSPTWFDQRILPKKQERPFKGQILWAGRMERPKDPTLAVRAFINLPERDWHLHMVGDGSELADIVAEVQELPQSVRARITLHGRLPQAKLYELMSASDVFLMTSQPGYEGFPRVLVEGLACGLPAVVTRGSDTGGIVREQVNGFVVGREPAQIAAAISRTRQLDSSLCAESVDQLSAERVVDQIFQYAGVQHDDSCGV